MDDKRKALWKCGKELFSSKSYKDTKVSEITEMAEMAAGTFYIYFDSKSALFMEIFLEENKKLKERIMENVNLDADPQSVIKELMYRNYEGMKENPILREWYNKEIFAKIEQQYRDEKNLEQLDFLYEHFIEIVKDWQAEGKMRADIDAEMIMAIFTSIIVMETHKEEVGIEYFPQILNYLIEFVLEGLTKKTHPKERNK
ncbi:MAG: TetR family transcriptional regulator [Candidatus Lokiarchaeota archaeon]|nr:TetR family transcriptional regulator [Candidatus Lokiarchaeota archaeon]